MDTLKQFIKAIECCDFSEVKAFFVSSVPGSLLANSYLIVISVSYAYTLITIIKETMLPKRLKYPRKSF
jgi:hypothetical protein